MNRSFLMAHKSRKLALNIIHVLKDVGIFKSRGKRAGKCVRLNSTARQTFQPLRAPDGVTTNASSSSYRLNDRCSAPALRFALTNARSLVNKIDEMAVTLLSRRYDFAGITETWLTSECPDAAVTPSGFSIVRSDRCDKRGGGVAILVSNEWKRFVLNPPKPPPPQIDCCWIWSRPAFLPRTISGLLIAAVYAPPNLSFPVKRSINDYLIDTLDWAHAKYSDAATVIFGDFNDVKVDKLCSNCNLQQIVSEPTRADNILDLVLTDLPAPKVLVLPPVASSDHNVIEIVVPLSQASPSKPATRQFVYRPKPESAIRECGAFLSSLNWSHIFDADSLDLKYDLLKSTVCSAYEEFFPLRTGVTYNKSKPWINEKIIELIKQKNRIWKSDPELFKSIKNETASLIKQAKSEYFINKIKPLTKCDPRNWFKRIKELGGATTKATAPNCTLDPDELNNYFHGLNSVAPALRVDELPAFLPSLGPKVFNELEVVRLLGQIRLHKAQPKHDIPNFVLKTFAFELAEPITHIFNESLLLGRCPQAWLIAEVVPLPKSPHPHEPSDFRPISKFPTLCRVLERWIAQVVTRLFASRLDSQQFGCTKGRSACLYLVSLIDSIHKMLDHPNAAASLLAIDYKKAFNSVDHTALARELTESDVPGFLLSWIFFFLGGIRQIVRVGPSTSELSSVMSSGIPQGTSLGPILFIIMVNSCPGPEKPRWKFVDDLSLIDHLPKFPDFTPTQNSLNTVDEWSRANKLAVNPSKCAVLLFGAANSLDSPPPLGLGNVIVPVQKEAKILGVIVQNDLKWTSHINAVVKKAHARLFFLRMLARAGVDQPSMVKIYSICIRPILEYCSPVWGSSISQTLCNQLDNVQKRACKIIARDSTTRPQILQKSLGLEDLSVRREAALLKLGRNILVSKPYRSLLPPSQGSLSGRNTRQVNSLAVIRCCKESRRKSAIPAAVRLFNSSVSIV